MEIAGDNEEEEQKIIDPEEAKKLEKEIQGEENKLALEEIFIDDNAIFIDYEPEIILLKLEFFKGCTIYERKTYIKHLVEMLQIAGKECLVHLPNLLNSIAQQSDEFIRDFLVQVDSLIEFLQQFNDKEDPNQNVRDILIPALLQLMKSSDIHIKQNAGKYLSEIAIILNEQDRQKYVLDIIKQNAQDQSDEEIRIVTVQQLTKISQCLSQKQNEEEITQIILNLGVDPQLRVRKEVITNLMQLCENVSKEFLISKIYPFYIQKCQDTNWGTRKCCAEIILQMANLVDNKQKIELQNIFLKFLKDANKWVKIVSYKKLGEFSVLMSPLDKNEQLFICYQKMVTPEVGNLAMDNELLIACAYNFPAILQVFGKEKWPQMQKILLELINFKRQKIKQPLACALHEIAKIIGKDNSWKDLVSVLNDFLEDYSDNVKYGSVKILADFLTVFEHDQREKMIDVFQVLQENRKKWRIRELIAHQLQKLIDLYEPETVYQYIVPIALKLCQDSVATVREVATSQVFYLIQELKDFEDGVFKDILIDQIKAFSSSHRFSQRISFVQISKNVMIHLPDIFQEYFLPVLVKLSQDRVKNVRINLAKLIVQHIQQQGQFIENSLFIEIKNNLSQDKNSIDVNEHLRKIDQNLPQIEYNRAKYCEPEKQSQENDEQQQQSNESSTQQ